MTRWSLPLLVLAAATIAAPGSKATETSPRSDWCAAIGRLSPGEELVLGPGDYPGPCTVSKGGTAAAPIVVRARDLMHRPRIVYRGRSSNVLNIAAGHVTIRGLEIGPTEESVDAIRIYAGSDVRLEDCRFVDLGGIAVVANNASLQRLTVRRNEVLRSRATGMYFGCHDGAGCALSDILVEQNYLNEVDAPDSEVGYGVQVKLNTSGVVRDNVVVKTKGPGIMVYGARDVSRRTVVERNFVMSSRTASGIVIGGGPAIVRNNVAILNAEAGIAVENYGRRGLLRDVVIVHNTVYGNAREGIRIPGEGSISAVVGNNAIHWRTGTGTLPPPRPGLLMFGNADCTTARACFVDPHVLDFSPLALPLGEARVDGWAVDDDYFQRRRPHPPTAGAIERPGGALRLGVREQGKVLDKLYDSTESTGGQSRTRDDAENE